MKVRIQTVIQVWMLVLGLTGAAWAQQTGSLSGTVRDAQGGVLPGSRIPIVAPDDARLLRLGLIVIANPNYAREIGDVLQQRGFSGRVLTL